MAHTGWMVSRKSRARRNLHAGRVLYGIRFCCNCIEFVCSDVDKGMRIRWLSARSSEMRIVKGTLLLAGALVLASRAGWGSSLFQSAAPHRPFRADATRVSVRPRASLNGAARAAGSAQFVVGETYRIL